MVVMASSHWGGVLGASTDGHVIGAIGAVLSGNLALHLQPAILYELP